MNRVRSHCRIKTGNRQSINQEVLQLVLRIQRTFYYQRVTIRISTILCEVTEGSRTGFEVRTLYRSTPVQKLRLVGYLTVKLIRTNIHILRIRQGNRKLFIIVQDSVDIIHFRCLRRGVIRETDIIYVEVSIIGSLRILTGCINNNIHTGNSDTIRTQIQSIFCVATLRRGLPMIKRMPIAIRVKELEAEQSTVSGFFSVLIIDFRYIRRIVV